MIIGRATLNTISNFAAQSHTDLRTASSPCGLHQGAGHPNLWIVTSSSTKFYIGLNQRYASASTNNFGSGVCKIRCYDFGSTWSIAADTLQQQKVAAGPAPDEAPEFQRLEAQAAEPVSLSRAA